MGQGRFGHDRILSGVIMCHMVGNEALVAHVLGFGGLVQYGKKCGTFVQSSCG